MKRRISKRPEKAKRQRAELKRAGELKKAIARHKYGSQGAASRVRKVKLSEVDQAELLAKIEGAR